MRTDRSDASTAIIAQALAKALPQLALAQSAASHCSDGSRQLLEEAIALLVTLRQQIDGAKRRSLR